MSCATPDADEAPLAERIIAVVRAIPAGSVSSYGVVARRAGLARGARLAARVLSRNEDPTLPWHRVVRADGRIAFPVGSAAHDEQARRLQAEGVRLVRGRVAMPHRQDDLDAAIWG